MLPTTSSQAKTNSTSVPGSINSGNWPVVLAGALILYTAGVGWGLISGAIAPQRTFLLMALPCLLPLVWYAYGYFKSKGDRDLGLLLSAIGWLLIVAALIFKDIAVAAAAGPAALQATSPMVSICAAFGILCLLVGAGASWVFWASHEDSATPSRQSQHY